MVYEMLSVQHQIPASSLIENSETKCPPDLVTIQSGGLRELKALFICSDELNESVVHSIAASGDSRERELSRLSNNVLLTLAVKL